MEKLLPAVLLVMRRICVSTGSTRYPLRTVTRAMGDQPENEASTLTLPGPPQHTNVASRDLEEKVTTAAEDAVEPEVASRKRGAPSTSDGSGRKQAKCEHGRQKHQCKDCGGSSICEHGRQKHQCKECGGSGICTHGRQRHQCKECRGWGICTHGRQKHQCKECGGSGICPHGRQKSTCKECGGSRICPHGREKRTCKDCWSASRQAGV